MPKNTHDVEEVPERIAVLIGEIAKLRGVLRDIDKLCDRALAPPKSSSKRYYKEWLPPVNAIRTIKNVIEEVSDNAKT